MHELHLRLKLCIFFFSQILIFLCFFFESIRTWNVSKKTLLTRWLVIVTSSITASRWLLNWQIHMISRVNKKKTFSLTHSVKNSLAVLKIVPIHENLISLFLGHNNFIFTTLFFQFYFILIFKAQREKKRRQIKLSDISSDDVSSCMKISQLFFSHFIKFPKVSQN